MKRLHFDAFTGSVNQLHDELLQIPELQGSVKIEEPLMAPVFEDQMGVDNHVRRIQVGEEQRGIAIAEEPNLRIESRENHLWITIPDDFDEKRIFIAINDHVAKPPPPTMQEKINAAKDLDEIKKVLADYFQA